MSSKFTITNKTVHSKMHLPHCKNEKKFEYINKCHLIKYFSIKYNIQKYHIKNI